MRYENKSKKQLISELAKLRHKVADLENGTGTLADLAVLRRRAEERLRGMKAETRPSGEDTESLIHELQVHQIELEMQNHELRRIQHYLERTRDRYLQLYDLAPVGYLTLSEQG
ncbi:MAG: hypothetical protein WCA08_19210, partial [Desulfoferrobacter sp.]